MNQLWPAVCILWKCPHACSVDVARFQIRAPFRLQLVNSMTKLCAPSCYMSPVIIPLAQVATALLVAGPKSDFVDTWVDSAYIHQLAFKPCSKAAFVK